MALLLVGVAALTFIIPARPSSDRVKGDTSVMATTLLTIGEFSRMTHLSVKALRHYHDVGVLAPAAIDPSSGYRSYDVRQVASAQVIRRLRDLGMPLDSIAAVLAAPDVAQRNREIAAHLERMERQLEETQAAVSSLRSLLSGAAPRPVIAFRSIPTVTALAIAEVVSGAEIVRVGHRGVRRARGGAQSHRASARRSVRRALPWRVLRDHQERGHGVRAGPRGVAGRASGGTSAVACGCARWRGSRPRWRCTRARASETDRTYGALGTVVAERAIGVDGPIREYYPDGFDPAGDSPHRDLLAGLPHRLASAEPG